MTLFELKREDIHITITARFEGEGFIVEGYVIGKTLDDWWGDSDYEYGVTVREKNIPRLSFKLHCDPGDKETILKEVTRRFNGNHCFSEFSDFLTENSIECEGFSW